MRPHESCRWLSIYLTALFICVQFFAIHVVLKSFNGETMDHRVPDQVVVEPFLVPHVRSVDVTQSGDFARVVATAFVAAFFAISLKPFVEAAGGQPIGAAAFEQSGARGRVWLFRRRLLI